MYVCRHTRLGLINSWFEIFILSTHQCNQQIDISRKQTKVIKKKFAHQLYPIKRKITNQILIGGAATQPQPQLQQNEPQFFLLIYELETLTFGVIKNWINIINYAKINYNQKCMRMV